jgi:hypothetical protein
MVECEFFYVGKSGEVSWARVSNRWADCLFDLLSPQEVPGAPEVVPAGNDRQGHGGD